MMLRVVGGLAAAVVVGVGLSWWSGPTATGLPLGDVLDKVARVQSLHLRVTRQGRTTEVWAKQPHHLRTHHSEQYRKAWFASFPPNLWPAEEEEDPNGPIFLKLKDGTRLLASEPTWTRKS